MLPGYKAHLPAFYSFVLNVVGFLKIQLSLIPLLGWVFGFSWMLLSVSEITSVHLATRCMESDIQMPIFLPDPCA